MHGNAKLLLLSSNRSSSDTFTWLLSQPWQHPTLVLQHGNTLALARIHLESQSSLRRQSLFAHGKQGMAESDGQRRELAPLWHVSTPAEVVIVVPLNGIKDLTVQDECGPAQHAGDTIDD